MSAMASQDACTDDAKNKAATGNMEGKIFSEEKANKQVRDKAREVKTYTSLANAYYAHGDYKKAIEYYQLHLAKEVGDQAGEGLAYGNLGNAYQSLGDYKKAIEYHLLRLSFTEEVGDRAGEARAYGNLGNAYLSLSDYKKAIEYHQLHLNLAKEVGDRDEEGRANSNLGNSYHSLGQFETAKEYHQLDLGIAKEVGDKAAEGRAYGNLGNAYESLGDAIKAIHYHQLRLRIAKELGDRAGEGRAYGNLGNAYCSRGGFKKAIEYHQLHLSIAKEVGDRAGEGRANSNLGNAYCSLGNFIKAIECHKLYRSVAREMGNRDGEGRANGNLGNAHRRLGNFKKAIKYHELCLSITKEVGDRAGEGSAHGNLGNVYTSLGDFTKAIECLELRRSIAQEVGDRAGEGRAYGSLGNAYLSLDKYEEAVECYNQRRTIAQERGNKHGEGIAYGSLGNCYESLGDLPKAIENHQLCLSIAKEEGDRAGEAGTYCNLGNSYYRLDDFQKAIEYHQLDLSASKELKDRAGQGRAYCNLGHAYQSLGDLCQSESCYKSSVELFDNLRDRLKTNDEWKISLRDQYDEVYIGLMTVLLKQNKVNEALFTAERGRAQALMDLMKSQYGFSQKVAKDTKIVETLSYITSQTVFVAVGTEELNFWVLEKGKDVQFRKKKIDKASLKKDVITTLDSLTRDAKQEIGVNRDIQCENRTLDELEPIVENPADKKSEGKRMVAYSKDSPLRILYEMIINPIADLIHGYELTIVPDGPLFLVPFPAFLDHCSKFLCESFRIRLIPSLSSLKLLAECSERYHSESKALLVGEPWVKEVRRKRMDELPCAKKEVEMIGGILNVSPLVGKNATKAEVKKRLSSAAIVHIAAHGKMETGEIALSPKPWPERSSKIPKEDDYLLTMKDVLELKLRARLVVLSCCHSGRGEIKAEGVVGIARAFLGAGARSVLVSLWAINDEATLEFMRCFYQHLVEGRSVGEAINLARKALKESETLSDVKHWAPFMLIGDDITLDFGRKG